MPFGKYRGLSVHEIPKSYLLWLIDNIKDLSPTLKREVEAILRIGETVHFSNDGLGPLLKDWYRALAKDYHPDRRGGNTAAMAAINDARDRLLEKIESVKLKGGL